MMRRLLLAAAVAAVAAVPIAPAHAGPAACVVTSGIPVCAGNCSTGDPVDVYVVGVGSGTAYCGGSAAASCPSFRGACTGSGRAPSGGALTCRGTAPVVICVVGIQAT